MTSATPRTRVLVTGATGWLGRHIVTALQRRAHVDIIAACRRPEALGATPFADVRVGDLRDPSYRVDIVRDIDVVIHAGTWSSFWGHAEQERQMFLEPSLGLIDASAMAGVQRFIAASTVAMGTPAAPDARVPDDDAPVKRGMWPHHDAMVDVENHMRAVAGNTSMVSLRLGHFMGAGNDMGLVSAIIPRLRTRQVPWVDHGRARLPLVAGEDLGEAFALAATTNRLASFETIAIVGTEQPTAREVFTFVAETAGVPRPAFSVPTSVAYRFGAVTEAIHRFTPAKAPFLTRALVHVGENWHMEASAAARIGYRPRVDWRQAIAEDIEQRRAAGFPWPHLAQPMTPWTTGTVAPSPV